MEAPNVRRQNLAPQWKPDQSGNPSGLPGAVGSRTAFSPGFTRDLADWAEKGKASMLYTAEKQPVNTASRMESHGCAGRIQVTEAVRKALLTDYEFDGPNTVDVKGKGPMAVWFLGPQRM